MASDTPSWKLKYHVYMTKCKYSYIAPNVSIDSTFSLIENPTSHIKSEGNFIKGLN